MIGLGMTAAMAAVGCSDKNNSVVNDVNNTAQEAAEAAVNVADLPAVTVIKEGEQIPESNGKPRIIDFNAEWCGPCKRFAPNYDMIAERHRNEADFYSVNVDENPQLAANYNVESIPTVIYLNADGSYTATTGYMDANTFDNAVRAFLGKK